MKTLQKYFQLWLKLTANSFMSALLTRFSATIFLIGKFLRFVFFMIFLLTVFSQTRMLAGYNEAQAVFFFLTFNLIDTVTQLFFREVYRFRPMVVSGDFDLILVKPVSPLFRALAGGADPLDLIMLVPYIGIFWYTLTLVAPSLTLVRIFGYLLLFGNGLLIATGFHILVLALAILTTEIDHAVMIYRDLTSMGRIPVDIYQQPLRALLTFVVPVGIMMTFPAQALLGLLKPGMTFVSLVMGVLFFLLCLRVWRFSLTRYSSASS